MSSSLVDLAQLKAQMREIECSGSIAATDPACADEEAQAFKKILKLASVREQATEKLRTRLARDGFSEAAIASALERATRCRIVDDERFAEALIRTRLAQGKGRRGIERELDELSIPIPNENIWIDAAEQMGAAEELERALALLGRKPPRSKNLREGAYRKLVQNGYSSDIAASASRRWVEAREHVFAGAE